jgi:hypothetical protein
VGVRARTSAPAKEKRSKRTRDSHDIILNVISANRDRVIPDPPLAPNLLSGPGRGREGMPEGIITKPVTFGPFGHLPRHTGHFPPPHSSAPRGSSLKPKPYLPARHARLKMEGGSELGYAPIVDLPDGVYRYGPRETRDRVHAWGFGNCPNNPRPSNPLEALDPGAHELRALKP